METKELKIRQNGEEPFKRLQNYLEFFTMDGFIRVRNKFLWHLMEIEKTARRKKDTTFSPLIWERCIMHVTLVNKETTIEMFLQKEDGSKEVYCCPEDIYAQFKEIKKVMYKQAPHEGIWLQCTFIFSRTDEKEMSFDFNYDRKDLLGNSGTDSWNLIEEFKQYPRSKEYTPEWWQSLLNGEAGYIPVTPTKVSDDLISKLISAYKSGKGEEIQTVYSVIQLVEMVNRDGVNLLHVAAKYADHKAIESLLAAGIKPLAKDRSDRTALHYLAEPERSSRFQRTDQDIKRSAEVLLKARVSALLRDKSGKLCYHTAAECGNLAFIRGMINCGVKLDMTGKDGQTLLHLIVGHPAKNALNSMKYARTEEEQAKLQVILRDCFNLCQELMEYGLDAERKDSRNNSAAELATQLDLKELAILLRGEYDPEDPESEIKVATGGKTLHMACDEGDEKAVEALLKLGADPDEVFIEYEYKNMTPLAVAGIKVQTGCIKLLLDAGADPNFKGGEKGEGVLSFIIDKAKEVYENRVKKTPGIVLSFLLEHGLEVNGFITARLHTPLNYTCTKMHWNDHTRDEFRAILLESGQCDVNIPDVDGITPLMNFVSYNSHRNNLENDLIFLLEQGADLTAKDKEGNTPLMYAASNKNRVSANVIADLLFAFGDPLPGETNNKGQTALDLAVEQNNQDLVKYILNRM